MTVTIWDTEANGGAGAIAAVVDTRRVPVDPADPGAGYTDEIVSSTPLARVDHPDWSRPAWSAAMRADPAANGATNFEPGWTILDDVYPSPSPAADEMAGDLPDVPVVDLEARTSTWTRATVAKPLATRKAEVKAVATARFRAIVAAGKTIGGVTVDLTSEGFERLGQAQAALAAGAGAIKAVTVRGGPIDLPDAATAAGVIAAARAYYLAAAETERALYDAVDAAADHAGLDAIDVAAGTVGGAGGWPG